MTYEELEEKRKKYEFYFRINFSKQFALNYSMRESFKEYNDLIYHEIASYVNWKLKNKLDSINSAIGINGFWELENGRRVSEVVLVNFLGGSEVIGKVKIGLDRRVLSIAEDCIKLTEAHLDKKIKEKNREQIGQVLVGNFV